ncbi:hypothetical protein DV711_15495 [Motiliproteus coralliicola]|uniref:META domain-containing protein n=1 Tax=Motiliproteus coralliicola TaxID=2283196 RepID=A0A369WEG3_9GAMM|nr:hypothetical protein [Motiliproteus coralliicola]RDE19006.1 hypothetical protein DV711_15495 [Motiliproteus coralliicola]
MYRFIFLPILALLVAGCSNSLPMPEKATSSDRFDGVWLAERTLVDKYQRYGRINYTCTPAENQKSLLFIHQGHVGLIGNPESSGVIDDSGLLFLRATSGEFLMHSEMNKSRDEIYHGRFESTRGDGRHIAAISGESGGCKGSFKATKIDLVAHLYTDSSMRAHRFTLRADDKVSVAEFWSKPIYKARSSLIALIDDARSRVCSGYWNKSDEYAMSGRWALYCGDGVTLDGNWHLQGSRLTAEGFGVDEKPVIISGMINNPHRKSWPQSGIYIGNKPKESHSEIVNCRIGRKEFMTSSISCLHENGEILP